MNVSFIHPAHSGFAPPHALALPDRAGNWHTFLLTLRPGDGRWIWRAGGIDVLVLGRTSDRAGCPFAEWGARDGSKVVRVVGNSGGTPAAALLDLQQHLIDSRLTAEDLLGDRED